MTAHSKLRKEICEYLKTLGAWYVCTNSQGYGRKGIPDIIACIGGEFVAIEVKVAPDKPTAWQKREIEDIERAGGGTVVAYSLEDAQNVL